MATLELNYIGFGALEQGDKFMLKNRGHTRYMRIIEITIKGKHCNEVINAVSLKDGGIHGFSNKMEVAPIS